MSSEHGEIDSAALARYLQGECDTDEATAVKQWIAADPAHAATADALRAAFDKMTDDALWQNIAGRLDSGPQTSARGRAQRRWQVGGTTGGGRWRWAIAASLIGGVAVGVAMSSLRRSIGAESSAHEYTTAAGQRLGVRLADGTWLTLAPASHVHVVGRDVELDGEAYFDVHHDATRPFVVHTHGTVIRDIGTSFDVRAYAGDSDRRVAVTAGRVAVHDATHDAALAVGDVATVRGRRLAVEHNADVAALTAWMMGRLAFRDTRLADAAPELARWYDLDVRVDSALTDRPLTVTFEDAEPVDRAIATVALLTNARIEQHGRVVIFHSLTEGL